jgi:hypothetical protein
MLETRESACLAQPAPEHSYSVNEDSAFRRTCSPNSLSMYSTCKNGETTDHPVTRNPHTAVIILFQSAGTTKGV